MARAVALGTLLLGACGDELSVGENFAGAGGAGGEGGVAGISGTLGGLPDGQAGNPAACTVVRCRENIYACGDCLDNDSDGRTDAEDSACLGPCDNDEQTFHDGHQIGARCRQDCYFDLDTGAGNDDCNWSHECDPLSLPPDFPPSGEPRCAFDLNARIQGTDLRCADVVTQGQSATCQDVCMPLTPNGCDCFGCCELPAGSGRHVYLGSARDDGSRCDPGAIDDPERCRQCTPVRQCYNRCEECEFCVGRPAPAPSCTNGGSRCPPGVAACDLSAGMRCEDPRRYCLTGCCTLIAL